jgi:uncharacterized SAM-binding protein YcdF (DUF218 family)
MKYDIIIIIGGGINKDGGLPPETSLRVKEGVKKYKKGLAPKILMSGRWGDDIDYTPKKKEAIAMKELAIDIGVPSKDILTETKAVDTITNAKESKEVIDNNDWKDILVVTLDFHKNRAERIFKDIFGDSYNIDVYGGKSNLEKSLYERYLKMEKTKMNKYSKLSSIVETLDNIADDVEKQDKNIALAIDTVSDLIEKKAFFNQSTWLPGRTTRAYPNKNTSNRLERKAVYVCLSCNLRRSMVVYRCPRCGHTMQKTFG